jgi:AraC-like DNA-binding protein
MDYLRRLQRAIDYIDAHLEGDLHLEDVAREACYSRSHFIWIFKAATGETPMEYARRRKLTEAAAAILSGADVADTVYRFGFSAQDVFTRAFRQHFGLPPARFRKSGGAFGRFVPALRLHPEGGTMKLSYNLDCQDERVTMRVEALLTDEVLRSVADVTISPKRTTEFPGAILSDLCDAQVLRVDQGFVKPNTAVFLDQDLRLLRQASQSLGSALAEALQTLDSRCRGMDAALKRYLVGYRGVDVGTFKVLLDGGYAWNHRETTGKYATAKIDIYEVGDTYDSFGPYLSGGYGFSGDRYVVQTLGEEGGIHAYLRAGLSLTDDRQYKFLMSVNRFVTDSLGAFLMNEIRNPHLEKAAEEAGFIRDGKPVVPVITKKNGQQCRDLVGSTRRTVADFIAGRHADIMALLSSTLPGKQGVPPDRMIVDLMRYVRMTAHRRLYEDGFYTDSLPKAGTVSVFRDRGVEL